MLGCPRLYFILPLLCYTQLPPAKRIQTHSVQSYVFAVGDLRCSSFGLLLSMRNGR